jgi:hypothetical protein
VLKFLSSNSGIEIGQTKTFFKTYDNSFTTESLISWFENQKITDRKKALQFVTRIHKLCVIHIVSGPSSIVDSSKQILQIQVNLKV